MDSFFDAMSARLGRQRIIESQLTDSERADIAAICRRLGHRPADLAELTDAERRSVASICRRFGRLEQRVTR